MAESARALLERLEEMRGEYGGDAGHRRLALLRALRGRRFASAAQVERLHELLVFLRAYPDSPEVLAEVDRRLASFGARSDLKRFRAALADSGIAGTDIFYRFYWITARWLARRWPDRLTIDWPEFEHRERLLSLFDQLLPYAESTALDMVDLSAREWIERLKGPGESDAAFLIRRFDRLAASPVLRERLYEQLDVPLVLAPGRDTPSRTGWRLAGAPVAFQSVPLDRSRPALRAAVRQPPVAVDDLSRRDARRLIDLARASMVTRSRDLDAFANADEEDVRMVEAGDGLRFACIGTRPERRLLLETSYGLLMILNGVPIGYALASSLFRSTEVAYNVFDTFRGGEAAAIFGRLLATIRQLFGSDVFAIDPYQLGLGNEEGLRSGAWWFYYKLGFRPHDPGVRRVLRGELARMKKDPRHRSSRATLAKLAADYLFFYLGRPRASVLGRIALGNIGLRASAHLAARSGGDREAGVEACAREAARRLGLRSRARFSPGERLAWDSWAPLLVLLPGVESWSAAERRALVDTVRAKGGRRESDFLLRFDRHPRLGRALLRLAG